MAIGNYGYVALCPVRRFRGACDRVRHNARGRGCTADGSFLHGTRRYSVSTRNELALGRQLGGLTLLRGRDRVIFRNGNRAVRV